jgi:hypothetical protein
MRTTILAIMLSLGMALAAAAEPTPAAPPAEDAAARVVEATAAIKSGDRAGAKKAALAEAKRLAVLDYIGARLPPGVMKLKAAEVAKIAADAESLVASFEESGSREEAGTLVMKFKIKLNRDRLDARLAAAGLVPTGPLPTVFVLVRGSVSGEELKSGWDRDPAEGGENACEAALAGELIRYGFVVIPARSGEADTAAILSPGNEAERASVFRSVHDKFSAGAMVVGVVTGEAEADRPVRVRLRLAAADTDKGALVWSGSREKIPSDREARSRAEALVEICRAAGTEAVQALYQSRLPSLVPGAEREVLLTLDGATNYPSIKELEKKLKTELPGVNSVTWSRMSPGMIELKLVATVAPPTLAGWLTSNQFGGMKLKIEESGDYQVRVQARYAEPKPATEPAPAPTRPQPPNQPPKTGNAPAAPRPKPEGEHPPISAPPPPSYLRPQPAPTPAPRPKP